MNAFRPSRRAVLTGSAAAAAVVSRPAVPGQALDADQRRPASVGRGPCGHLMPDRPPSRLPGDAEPIDRVAGEDHVRKGAW